jgi:hypothetical protein
MFIISELATRGPFHDSSKTSSPEVEVFDEYSPKLKGLTYGSDEYRKCLRAMKPAIEHHYKLNRHHPEHFENGIRGMNLVDLTEMFCDWLAASKRHDNGDIFKSIEMNAQRFGYDQVMIDILTNTARLLGEEGQDE